MSVLVCSDNSLFIIAITRLTCSETKKEQYTMKVLFEFVIKCQCLDSGICELFTSEWLACYPLVVVELLCSVAFLARSQSPQLTSPIHSCFSPKELGAESMRQSTSWGKLGMVKVAPGHFRNHLMPKLLAVINIEKHAFLMREQREVCSLSFSFVFYD
ncbi:hypothetical protein ZIOFF_055634 [Zingiber officinale]|uniref:50S ribosomal protein L9, chloroplastic n=1 Tax=Zingiber officinale TaxID=94328 RepID=A0A8J5KES6_ZINOF|nr:hypothetical protein ZIOFF_055634 [Zingiber officinale]